MRWIESDIRVKLLERNRPRDACIACSLSPTTNSELLSLHRYDFGVSKQASKDGTRSILWRLR